MTRAQDEHTSSLATPNPPPATPNPPPNVAHMNAATNHPPWESNVPPPDADKDEPPHQHTGYGKSPHHKTTQNNTQHSTLWTSAETQYYASRYETQPSSRAPGWHSRGEYGYEWTHMNGPYWLSGKTGR